jgi:hypothetical protein
MVFLVHIARYSSRYHCYGTALAYMEIGAVFVDVDWLEWDNHCLGNVGDTMNALVIILLLIAYILT